MNGLERTRAVMQGEKPDRIPRMPILHSALAPIQGVELGEYYTNPEAMARVAVEGARAFDLDGVQLSLGVTAEAEALGGEVVQPEDAAPQLQGHPLMDVSMFESLRDIPLCERGRIPGHLDALKRVVDAVGEERFVLATIRGPMVMAAQLCGVENLMMSFMIDPDGARVFLEFCNEKALEVGEFMAASGAHGVLLGEATCSPNFIAPETYREVVQPLHARLISGLRDCGWNAIGLHICGNVLDILDDIVATGVDFADIDKQAPLEQTLAVVDDRIALRGNLDPSADLRFGKPQHVQEVTAELLKQVEGHRWILSSGCDIGVGTSEENIRAMC